MSGSQHRPPGPHKRSRRAGPDRSTKQGFSRIPEEARPTVCRCLDEAGLGALCDLVGGLRFELSEVARMTQNDLGQWVLGEEVLPMPKDTSERLRELKLLLETQATHSGCKVGELLSDRLKQVTTQVRKALEETYPWVRNLAVNTRTLHQMADEAADLLYAEHPARLRTYRRNPYARAETVRPATTIKVADAFDAAMEPLLKEVWALCTPRARKAIEWLKGRGG
jgi:hypothetical protein